MNLARTKKRVKDFPSRNWIMTITACCLFHFLLTSSDFQKYSRIDFTGVWSIQKQEAVSGPQFANSMPQKVTIKQANDSLYLVKVSEDENGQGFISQENFDFSTNLFISTTGHTKRKKVSRLNWSDQVRSFTEFQSFCAPGNDRDTVAKLTDTWSLSSDGNILTLLRVSEVTGNRSWSTKAIYIKK